MRQVIPVVTIDGPSGSGKGSIAVALSQSLGWHCLDSGLIYRRLAWKVRSERPDLLSRLDQLDRVDLDQILEWAVTLSPNASLSQSQVNSELRSDEVGKIASVISNYALVRAALLEQQRSFRQLPGLVADGRDMGTLVFPDAPLKIYLDASVEERACRRYQQLKQSGFNVNLEAVLSAIQERDRRDVTRLIAPLKPAEDAITINTDHKAIPMVLEMVLALVQKMGLN